ncbi:MAG: nitroreductase family protein [Bacteroidales bacterium]|nr:nitroreductase family protein [Bacteroidales bacterium]
MADNYLEKRAEEINSGAKCSAAPKRASLDTLVRLNRSVRGYDQSYVVHKRQLEAMVAVNPKVASSVNQQALRFHLVTKGPEADEVNRHIKMGRALPELHLPFPGTEPEAFIVVCTTKPENPGLLIDLGISVQTMLLKAVDLGLRGLIIRNFDHAALQAGLGLPLEPICVVAVGKSAEKIELVEIKAGESIKYYRKDGVHYVPKLRVEDIII